MEFIGNLHLLLLHFPVALILVCFGFALVRVGWRRVMVVGRVERQLMPWTVIATALATATGFIHHLGQVWDEAHIGTHAILGYVTTGAVVLAWLAIRKSWHLVYLVLLTAAAITLVVGAHHGGMLSHPEGIF